MLTFILSSLTIDNYDNLGVTNLLYAQTDPVKANFTDNTSAATNSMVNLLDIPPKKVHVGDIDIAYKMFGKGDPLILFNGASDGMDAWDPRFFSSCFFQSNSDRF